MPETIVSVELVCSKCGKVREFESPNDPDLLWWECLNVQENEPPEWLCGVCYGKHKPVPNK